MMVTATAIATTTATEMSTATAWYSEEIEHGIDDSDSEMSMAETVVFMVNTRAKTTAIRTKLESTTM